MPNEIIHYADDENTIYLSVQAAYIACVALDFLLECEQEGLITPQSKTEGHYGFTLKEIQRLQTIRRLHEDLNLDLPSIDVILHLRSQLRDLAAQRNSFERKILEQQAELQQLKELLKRFQSAG